MPKSKLRSAAWFQGDDEVSLAHRVAFASVGFPIARDNSKPIIAIADSSSELNPCNLPLRDYIPAIRQGIIDAGGIAVLVPVMSLGEDLMKPSAMLYRNMLSMEVEEYLRSYPIDGVVLLANCDKSVPGSLMGAFSSNLPTLMFTAGARPVPIYKGKRIGTGTDLWRMWESFRTGDITKEEWADFEKCLNCGLGACNTMGTASSLAIMVETLGFMLPGTSTIPNGDSRRKSAARQTGMRIVEMVDEDLTPAKILSPASFRNAARVMNACGGSTNTIIHLLALSGRVNGEMTLQEFERVGRSVPVLANIEPSGTEMIQDFDRAGGLFALLSQLVDLIEPGAIICTGQKIGERITQLDSDSSAIRPRSNPLKPDGAFAIVTGNIAPQGAVIKTSAASSELLKHQGRAVVFHSYEEMRTKVDDLELEVTKDSILVLSGCGAVGVPGLPEWGMIPIPKKLAAAGVTDMVRITDARMSGTSFGTCFLHVSPEGAIGGNIALIENGDLIEIDVAARSISLMVSDEVLAIRRQLWKAPKREHLRGWPALYQERVMQPDRGCDLDFLCAPTEESRRFVEPVVGRS